jgi:Uma2 family endonuclease
MMRKPTPNEQRVVLPSVSWSEFETLLKELGSNRTTRLTYDRGQLEMMTPLPEHDRCNRLIESLVMVLVDELRLSIEPMLPIFLKAGDRQRAAELDAGYYLQTLASHSHPTEVDLTQQPPPDLVVEIAINKSTLDKLKIYADLGIPEIWRYITKVGDDVLKGSLLIYQLQDYQYVQRESSVAFPMLSSDRILQFIQQSDSIGLVQALQILRHWAQENK